MQIQMIPMHSAVFAASPLSHPSILLRRQRGEFKNQQISRSLPIELLALLLSASIPLLGRLQGFGSS